MPGDGTANVLLIADSMTFDTTAVINVGAKEVTLRQKTNATAINLGSTTDTAIDTLELSDAELDRITAGTINIGNTSSGSIKISAAISREGTTNLALTTGSGTDIAFDTDATPGSLNANSGNVTLSTSGTGGIISGTATTDIIAAELSLTAGSGGIGTSGNPLIMDVDSLTTATDGPQLLQETNSLTIAASGLDAHSQTITLVSGTFALVGAERIDDDSPLSLDGATLKLNGFDETLGGMSSTNSSSRVVNGSVIPATLKLNLNSVAGVQFFNGIFGGPGANDNNFGIIKNGTDQFVLQGANTYDGITSINAGSLNLLSATALGSTVGNTVVNSGARLFIGSNLIVNEAVTVSGAGGGPGWALAGNENARLAGPVTLAGNTTFAVFGDSSPFTISGPISDGGAGFGITVDPFGLANRTLILSGTNTYTGATVITSGVLRVNGSITSSVIVGNGTLAGTGATGAVTVNSGGNLAPGSSLGILHTGNLALSTGSTFTAELNGTSAGAGYDQLDVAGSVNLGNSTLAVTLGFSAPVGTGFVLLNNDEDDDVTGTFAGLAEGAIGTVGTIGYRITYVGGDGNDIVLTVLPPPTTTVRLDNGNLSIEDTEGGDTIDTLTLQADTANNRYIINDPNNRIRTSIAGAMGDGTCSVAVPFSAVTGNDVYVFALAGDDSLTVDYSFGNFPKPIYYEAGAQTTGDSLSLIGGETFDNVTHNFSGPNSGIVDVTGNARVSYLGLEPIADSLNAANRVFMFNGGAEQIDVTDAAGANTNINSTLGKSVTFANPTGSLTINAGWGDDAITVASVDVGFNAKLTINGGTEIDVVNLNSVLTLGSGANNGDLSIDAETIHLNAATIDLDGGTNAGSATFTGNVVLGTGVTIDVDAGGTDGIATFNGDINGGNSLLVDAGSGTVSLQNVGNTTPVGFFQVNANGLTLHGTTMTGASTINLNPAGSIDRAGREPGDQCDLVRRTRQHRCR